jgi:hypothetical protein
MSEPKASPRAREFWKRMLAWYGARMADQYGMTPPPDWCEAVDRTCRAGLERALAEIKQQHAIHPPTYPQFDAIVARVSRVILSGPSMHQRLREYVVKHRMLTRMQIAMPWTYRFVESECVAVDIPDDGETKGFRVRVADMPVVEAGDWHA